MYVGYADRGNRAVRPTAALQKLIEENLEPAAKRLSMGAVRTAMHTRVRGSFVMRPPLPPIAMRPNATFTVW